MTSIRLKKDLEVKINKIAKIEKKSKSQIITESIQNYIENYPKNITNSPYELGKDFCGKYNFKSENFSTEFKNIIKGKLVKKYNK